MRIRAGFHAIIAVLLLLGFGASLRAGDDGYMNRKLRADANGTVYLSAKDIAGTIEKNSYKIGAWHPDVWRWTQGDKPEYALPRYDDTQWQLVKHLTPDSLRPDWTQVMWFRTRIILDSSLRYTSVAMLPYQVGAAEYYLNGRLIASLGTPSQNADKEQVIQSKGKPIILQFGEEAEYVLAVRYSFHQMPSGYAVVPSIKASSIVWLAFAPTDEALDVQRTKESYFSVRYLIGIGMMLALGLLHVALFAFYPKQRFHLIYSAFTLLVALRFLTVYVLWIVEPHPGVALFFNLISNFYNSAIPLVCWLLFYALFYDKMPRRRLWAAIVSTVAVIIALFVVSGENHKVVYNASMVIILVLSLDAARIAIRAMRKKEVGALLMLVGVLDFAFMWTFRWLVEGLRILPFTISPNVMETTVYIGYMAVPLAMSLYIALVVSRTQISLEEQIVHVKELSEHALEQERHAKELDIQRTLLEADNDRKTRELEEARTLQLSMLPSKLPNHPRYEIAAYMRTATEVGGDYYDFRYSPETGALMAAVGDATGHGMKAGYLVSTTKSYFQTLADSENGAELLSKISSGIKNMNLRGMYMCLALVRCIGNEVHIAIAGMPPVVIYRAKTRTLEHISIKALPLGSVSHFEYREVVTTLDVDDVLLIMTDGLPELFNADSEMLDYERLESCFLANAHRSPAEIVSALKTCAEAWMGSAALLDDMTLVALKMKALPVQSLTAQPIFPAQQVITNANGQSHSKVLSEVEVY
ncbi:MAG: SpoIIE family protein phosphatase [Candidatus Kapabacteria bacterium]|nr:SpoIIE family protein phosphatase [Candidatus Kapabacteria bacterium]